MKLPRVSFSETGNNVMAAAVELEGAMAEEKI
jgi:hypothetical protein